MSTRSITSRATRASLIFIFLLALPGAARASVIISEVMYDPPGTNSKQGWFELYNDGTEAVDIGTWSVTDGATGSSGALTKHALNVPPKNGSIGSASIPAGGYVIVADDAATFEATYPSVPAVLDSVFGISNPDAGAEVGLIDAQGNAVDTFSFIADPYASNKGNSLQRSGVDLVSALPTPGAANATEAYVPPKADDEDSEDSGGSGSSKTPSMYYVAPPAPVVFADAGGDRTVIVGADTAFRAQAYNRDRAAFRSARFIWNFGDGASAEGSQVMHHFSYPGRYDVELYITNQNYSAASSVVIEAKEAAVAMVPLAGGGVSIQNRSGRDLDLSYWEVAQDTMTFKLPEHSVVLKDAAINIDQATLGFAATDAKLLYPNEAEVAMPAEPVAPSAAASAPAQDITVTAEDRESVPIDVVPGEQSSAPSALPAAPSTPAAPEVSSSSAVAPQGSARADLAAAATASGAAFPLWASLGGLGGILGLGVAGVLAVRRKPSPATETTPSAEEFDIED